MNTLDYTTYTDERLNEIKTSLVESQKLRQTETESQILPLIQSLLPNWTLVHLNDSSMSIGFKIGEYSDGSPRYRTIDIYFGQKFCEDSFRFDINTSAFGSFAIDEPSEYVTYFKTVGIILNDTEFQSKLKSILISYAAYMTTHFERYAEVRREISRRADIIKKQLLIENLKERIEETKINLTSNKYVLVAYDVNTNVADTIYRKKPCRTVAFGTEHEMNIKLYREYNRYTSQNMRVLATSKVKIVNL